MKITIILAILTAFMWLLTRGMVNTMDYAEVLHAKLTNEYPKRVLVSVWIFETFIVSTVISLIVTIINW